MRGISPSSRWILSFWCNIGGTTWRMWLVVTFFIFCHLPSLPQLPNIPSHPHVSPLTQNMSWRGLSPPPYITWATTTSVLCFDITDVFLTSYNPPSPWNVRQRGLLTHYHSSISHSMQGKGFWPPTTVPHVEMRDRQFAYPPPPSPSCISMWGKGFQPPKTLCHLETWDRGLAYPPPPLCYVFWVTEGLF